MREEGGGQCCCRARVRRPHPCAGRHYTSCRPDRCTAAHLHGGVDDVLVAAPDPFLGGRKHQLKHAPVVVMVLLWGVQGRRLVDVGCGGVTEPCPVKGRARNWLLLEIAPARCTSQCPKSQPRLACRGHVGVDREEWGPGEEEVVYGGQLPVEPEVDVDDGDAHQLVHFPAAQGRGSEAPVHKRPLTVLKVPLDCPAMII